jgi:hypothetical protein
LADFHSPSLPRLLFRSKSTDYPDITEAAAAGSLSRIRVNP